MEQRKTKSYLLSFALICVMAGIFGWNVVSGYFSFLDPFLSGIMAVGFAVAALCELDNYRKALKRDKEEKK